MKNDNNTSIQLSKRFQAQLAQDILTYSRRGKYRIRTYEKLIRYYRKLAKEAEREPITNE